MKRKVFVFVIILISVSGYSQTSPQNWNWYFGYMCGINFSSGSPIAVNGSQYNAPYSSATISDNSGNLLFYTSGVNVWNRNNITMPNGTGLFGDGGSSQPALIVPKPDSSNIYYIFTSRRPYFPQGINYSEVDMTLNSGLGDVTVKNVQLIAPAYDKLCGLKHCNGIDYWVIAHGSLDSTYYAFQVTTAGILAPVITNIGFNISNNYGEDGDLTVSPNGRKIAVAMGDSDLVQLFDFNSSSGILSNCITIHYPFIHNLGGPYGVSFSPDSKKLYVLRHEGTVPAFLYQYDITSGNQTTIVASQYIVDSTAHQGGDLQLGPDHKIYVEYQGNVGAINFPNISGAGCNYVHTAISHFFFSQTPQFGLPNMLNANITQSDTLNVSNISICSSHPILNSIGTGQSYLWSTGATTDAISIDTSGTYWVKIFGANYCIGIFNIVDTFHVTLNNTFIVNLGHDSAYCNIDSIILNAGNVGSNYIWSNGMTTQIIIVHSTGNYSVTVTDSICRAIDTVTITFVNPPIVNLGNDTTICHGDSVLLDAANTGDTYLWSSGATTQTITVSTSGIYQVTVSDGGCMASDSVTISVLNFPMPVSAFTVDTLSGCKPLIIHLTNTSSNATSYYWAFSGGGTSAMINPIHSYSHSGNDTITLIAFDSTACGVFSDTSVQAFYFNVYAPPQQPVITFSGDTLYSSSLINNQWYLDSSIITGATNSYYVPTQNGSYTVEVTDSNGCTATSTAYHITTGINELIAPSSHCFIFPNPMESTFTVFCQMSIDNCQLIIKDITGRTLSSTTISSTKDPHIIDVSTLSSGIYFYELKSYNDTWRGKFVKE